MPTAYISSPVAVVGGFVRTSDARPVTKREAGPGREYSVTRGRSQETEIHCPLSGDEPEERSIASRPLEVSELDQYRPFAVEDPESIAALPTAGSLSLTQCTPTQGNRGLGNFRRWAGLGGGHVQGQDEVVPMRATADPSLRIPSSISSWPRLAYPSTNPAQSRPR